MTLFSATQQGNPFLDAPQYYSLLRVWPKGWATLFQGVNESSSLSTCSSRINGLYVITLGVRGCGFESHPSPLMERVAQRQSAKTCTPAFIREMSV